MPGPEKNSKPERVRPFKFKIGSKDNVKMHNSLNDACAAQKGSGFQSLLQEKATHSGPKVLKGLPIRQRTASTQSAIKPNLSQDQQAALPQAQDAQQAAEGGPEPASGAFKSVRDGLEESPNTKGSQSLEQEALDAPEEAFLSASAISQEAGPSIEDFPGKALQHF